MYISEYLFFLSKKTNDLNNFIYFLILEILLKIKHLSLKILIFENPY